MSTKKPLVFIVLLLSASLLCSAECDSPKTVKELQDCWVQHWTDNQFDSVMRLYANDATLLRADGRFVNRADIKTYWERLRAVATVNFSTSVLPEVQNGNVGYINGTYIETDTKNGKPSRTQGGYVIIAKRSGGAWAVVLQVFIPIPESPVAPCPQCMA